MSTTPVQTVSYSVRQWIKQRREQGVEPNADAIWERIKRSRWANNETRAEEIFQHIARLDAKRKRKS